MPENTPTREEINAATRWVADRAPAGLSREEFNALVKQAIERGRLYDEDRNRTGAPSTERAAPQREGRPQIGFLGSLAGPELKRLRQLVSDALATPPGQPILARSRTGQLYRSEIGTPETAVKGALRGVADVGIDQLEAATSPLGIATLAAGPVGGAVARGARGVAAPALSRTGRALEIAGNLAHKPASLWSVYEMLSSHSPMRAAAAYAAPYAATTAGRGLQRLGALLAPTEGETQATVALIRRALGNTPD